MPTPDDDLLARLNALKQSSVSLKLAASPVDRGTSKSETIEDKLEQRLATLRAGGVVTRTSPIHLRSATEVSAQARISESLSPDSDPVRHWQQQDGDEQDLDDLLAELGPDDQWKLDPEDPDHIESLLKEAQSALPQRAESHSPRTSAAHEAQRTAVFNGFNSATESEFKEEDRQDDEEADEYVKQVLAELELESCQSDDRSPQEENSENDHLMRNGLNLPSTPADVPPQRAEQTPPSYEDSELEARFSKLALGGIDLPSTPTSKPSSSKPKVTANLKPKSDLPKYTDDEINSWCCICNDDGEVRCLGCDNDIYCNKCWQDGHGAGPGQERGHKAVLYNRRPPPTAAA